jgi:peptidyl-prolyl cis-trans isomerase B (cyclophilin B)
MSVKDYGKITLEVYPDLAPITVDNFLSLVKSGYYEDSVFHRIIEDFMIQGGAGDSSAKSIKGEFSSNGVYNPLKHERGVISMARTNVPDSASSQFFIMHEAASHLDGQYAAFGKVIDGMDVVDAIAVVDTDSNDAPYDDIVIEYVKIVEAANDTTANDTTATDTAVADTTAADTTAADKK